ncbi:MAG: transposase [Sulfuritalea sp.]|nr:transposase [Sulfuritalea sp.]MDP1981026.1 transposase [Sulfuritalea sp.]
MSYDNLRKGRCSLPGQFYLVTTVTADRQPLFADFFTARRVIAELRRTHDRGAAASMAWVLMPDHLHWLFQLGEGFTLSKVVQSFKGRSAREIRQLGEHREIWQRGYHDHALRAEEEVQGVARYLVTNPLRAGLVMRVGDYPHWDAVWM